MLQVIDAIASNPNDKTKVTLIYANVSEKDIILKEKLDAIVAKNPSITARCHVCVCVCVSSCDALRCAWWGRVTKDLGGMSRRCTMCWTSRHCSGAAARAS